MRQLRPLSACFALSWSLAGCTSSPARLGPVVEANAPAPFLAAPGRYPTQLEAQAAVDLAVARYGVTAVYTSFGVAPFGHVPARVALFACKPGLFRPTHTGIIGRPGFVHCHADVSDDRSRLIGRATMSFYSERGGWRLVSALEREFDAR